MTAETMPTCMHADLVEGEKSVKQHPLFSKLLRSPIQRAPPQVWTGRSGEKGEYPFSCEHAILAARSLWANMGQEPENPQADHDWMLGNLGYDKEELRMHRDTLEEAERRMWQFSELAIPPYYVCPACNSIV